MSTTLRGLQISTAKGASALTPEQKRFNTLIRQIEQSRKTLAAWQEQTPLYAQTHVQVILPLAKALAAGRREWTLSLGRMADQPGWTKAERETLGDMICTFAAELLEESGGDDAELKALFDKHSDMDFEAEQQLAREAMKEMAEAMTGLDLGDAADITSEEDLLRRMQQGMAARAASAEAQEETKPAQRKSPAQQRREAEAQQATQSVREVFRKLASALHPDRETDPAQRAAKTALMQKANQAYAASDLLALLELQLQIEQVDAGHLADASPKRVKHYNKVLAEQLGELRAELDRVELGFRFDFELGPGGHLDPTRLFGVLDQQAKAMRAAAAQQQKDMRLLNDKAAMKRWLKQERRRRREEDALDDLLGGGFF